MVSNTSNIIPLLSVSSEAEASAIVATLADHGISARVVGGYTAGFIAEAPGEVQVLVREEDLVRASQIAKEQGDLAVSIDWSTIDCGDREPISADEKADSPTTEGEPRPWQVSLKELLIIQSGVCVFLGFTQGLLGAAILMTLLVVVLFAMVFFRLFQIVTGSTNLNQKLRTVGVWLRSEERRVGKECRSRWSPYH